MDEEIEASPTSQRKRKKVSRRGATQKMSLTGRDNLEVVVKDQNTEDTIEGSNHLFPKRMWQSAYLLEENDRVQLVPNIGRSQRPLFGNDFRMSGPADFLSVSQLCAIRATNVNQNEESQWYVTESQFQKVDDAVKEFHESEIRSKQIDDSDRVAENLGEPNVSHRSDEIFADISTDDQTTGIGNVVCNSPKRRSSVLESILSEWYSASPAKIHRTQSESVQLSPKFIFNRKRCRKSYRRKPISLERRKLVHGFNKSAAAISTTSNIRPELRHKPKDPAHINDDVEDFDESMNIVDNIQNLSYFFSQSCVPTLVESNADTTEPTAMDVNSTDLIASKTSLNDEEDFLGFDGTDLTGGLVSITLAEFFVKCRRKLSPLASVTLPETFREFDADSDSSSVSAEPPIDNSDQLLLMEDDDLFANYQTQQHIRSQEVMAMEEPVVPSTSAVAAGINGIFTTKIAHFPVVI